MDFNSDKKKQNDALRKQKQSENAARKKQADLQKATADINRKKDAADRKQLADEAQAKAASNKSMQELEKMIKEVAKQTNSSDFKTKSAKKLVSTFKNRMATDQYFNKKVLNDFKSRGKSPDKQITARFNSVNYRAMKEGERSLKSLENSLTHSLRLSKKDVLEWEDELKKDNLYYHDGQVYTDEEFQQINQQIFDEIIADKEADLLNQDDIQNKKDVTKLSTSRSNYRKKVLSIAPKDPALIRALDMLEKGDRKQKGLDDENVSNIIKKTREIAFKRIQELNLSEAKAKQKQSNVNKFFEIREKHIKARSTKRILDTAQTCLVQENVFKIPHKNGDMSKIQAQEYMDVAQEWFKKVNPSHKVIFGAIHLDETADTTTIEEVDPETGDTINKLKCRSGDNLHFFVDGKNSKTGEYDLRKAQIDFARKEQHKLNETYGIEFDLNEERGYRLTDKEMTLCGQIMQMSFYTEMQEKLFNKHDLALKFLNSTEKKSFDYLQSCIQEHMPLNMRQNSRFQMKKAMAEQAQQEFTEVSAKVDCKKEQKTELSSEILSMLGDKDELTKDIKNLENKALEQALTKVDTWMKKIKNGSISDGFTALSASAAVKAIDKLAETQPKIATKVAKTAVTFEENQKEAIKEHLKVSNKLKNKKNEINTSSKFKR
ncbi:cell envelope integrity protein TolA [Moritella viscosa]|uniref:Large polyvalent protein-associated domain-containing protein n=1 Tax=Moritella viscosa TaxID=80854 RepID=A0ABY1HK06_9GAMM|nr:hypothetical protein [Moritella viscosa]SGZ03452.1 Putative uncharacterized protein [Moritella viscosa]SHO28234.1 Putative uncharacterized protein [Moritella viscosa]